MLVPGRHVTSDTSAHYVSSNVRRAIQRSTIRNALVRVTLMVSTLQDERKKASTAIAFHGAAGGWFAIARRSESGAVVYAY
jgi:hypothetical protein